jgi:hypothetical protein
MSHKSFSPLASLLLAIALAFAGVLPVSAAPPSNDDIASATVVTEPLPFTDTVDTSEATPGTGDPECSGGFNVPTVWYQYTPSQETYINANTFGSDYNTALDVYVRDAVGNLIAIACNDDTGGLQSEVGLQVYPSTTYYFVVSAFPGEPSGNLVFTVEPLRPLTVDLEIAPTGLLDEAGNVIVRGTITCSRLVWADIYVDVAQRVGHIIIDDTAYQFMLCNQENPWEFVFTSEGRKFRGGKVSVSVQVFLLDPIFGEHSQLSAAAEVQLKRR